MLRASGTARRQGTPGGRRPSPAGRRCSQVLLGENAVQAARRLVPEDEVTVTVPAVRLPVVVPVAGALEGRADGGGELLQPALGASLQLVRVGTGCDVPEVTGEVGLKLP